MRKIWSSAWNDSRVWNRNRNPNPNRNAILILIHFLIELPWAKCGQSWNTDKCFDPSMLKYANNSTITTTNTTGLKSSVVEYWEWVSFSFWFFIALFNWFYYWFSPFPFWFPFPSLIFAHPGLNGFVKCQASSVRWKFSLLMSKL
jgi:Sodium:neurotransmitter symporter family